MLGEFSSWWSTALLVLVGVALLWLGSVVIARMRTEATTMIVDRPDSDPLSPFLEAYRGGQMSEEEFRRIAEKVAPGDARALIALRSKGTGRGSEAGGASLASQTEPSA